VAQGRCTPRLSLPCSPFTLSRQLQLRRKCASGVNQQLRVLDVKQIARFERPPEAWKGVLT
jgi:hypothetical protein